ncbi:MAG: hypothetical protein HC923_06475 [Myxococcales bacterium]|nr:hypothetical protein [Myxococcales bacterium]
MTADLPRLTAMGRDVSRLLGALARTSRSRQLYSENNEALVLMRRELRRAADVVFRQLPEISLQVRADALVYNEDEVLTDDGTSSESMPFLLYRDGVRKLEIVAGVTDEELDRLVAALHHGRSGRSLEDDVVTHLWRSSFDHVRYVTVEVHVGDAPSDAAMEFQVDAVVRAFFSSTSEQAGTLRGINIDADEDVARALAEAMGSLDEMAPGFHPSATLASLPAYSGKLVGLAGSESLYRDFVTETADLLTIDATSSSILSTHLTLFDGAIVEGDLALAMHVLNQIRSLPSSDGIDRWLRDALSETRVDDRPACAVAAKPRVRGGGLHARRRRSRGPGAGALTPDPHSPRPPPTLGRSDLGSGASG